MANLLPSTGAGMVCPWRFVATCQVKRPSSIAACSALVLISVQPSGSQSEVVPSHLSKFSESVSVCDCAEQTADAPNHSRAAKSPVEFKRNDFIEVFNYKKQKRKTERSSSSKKLIRDYLMISKSWNTFLRAATARSTCSLVCVAMSATRTNVSCGAQAGGITGLINTPASKARAVATKVFSGSRT